MNREIEEVDVDNLVFQFQEGHKESGEKLLRMFGGHPEDKDMTMYLGKWYKLIKYGRIGYDDFDVRKFISCRMKGDKSSLFLKSRQSSELRKEARKIIQAINIQVSRIESADLKQEIRELFLIQAQRYVKVKKSVNFSGYLTGSFPYALHNHLKKRFKPSEPLVDLRHRLISFEDEISESGEDGIEINEDLFRDVLMTIEDKENELGNSWVRGQTCGEEFKELTPMQRLILKLHDEEKMKDEDIAEMMGVHINTIFRQRKRAGDRVKAAVERLIKEGYYG